MRFAEQNRAAMVSQGRAPGDPGDMAGDGPDFDGEIDIASFFEDLRINCAMWNNLSVRAKVDLARSLISMPRTPPSHARMGGYEERVANLVTDINAYCVPKAAPGRVGARGRIRAPGFAGTLSPEQRQRMITALSPTELASYQAMTPEAKTVFESNYADAHWDVISGTTAANAASAAQSAAYMRTTEQAIGLTFGTISTAMANNNQQVLAQIRSDSEARIAAIQAQLTRDLAPTDATRLRYQLESLQQTQALLDAQRNQTAQTYSYIAAGAVALLLGGGYLYMQSQSRKNPVVTRSEHKVFIPFRLLPKASQAAWRRAHPRRHAE